MKFHEMAKKAMGGDQDAMELIVIKAPKGAMDGMSPMEFIKKIADNMEFGGAMDSMLDDEDMSSSNYVSEEAPQEKDMVYAAKHKMMVEALGRAGLGRKEAEDVATEVCNSVFGDGGGMADEYEPDEPTEGGD